MEHTLCKISWKSVENWLRNRRNLFTTVNVTPTIVKTTFSPNADLMLCQWLPRINLILLNCLLLFFIHLALELLTQFPALNDEKDLYLWKLAISNIEELGWLSMYQKPFYQIQWYLCWPKTSMKSYSRWSFIILICTYTCTFLINV